MDERPNEPTAASRPDPGASVPPPPPPPPPAPTAGAAGPGQPQGSAADSWAVSAAGAEAGGARVRSGRARRTAVILGVVAATVLLVGGIGAAAVLFALRGSPERLSTRTPADADFFATAYLDPSAGQKLNLERLLRRFPALGSPDELRTKVDGALDGALAQSGLSSDDVRSWLGSQVAIAGRIDDAGVSFAALLDAADPDGAEAALAKVRSQDTIGGQHFAWTSVQRSSATIWVGRPEFGGAPSVLALDGDTVVLANSVEFASDITDTIAGDAPSLDASHAFRRAISSLPEEKLGLAYVRLGSVLERLSSGMLSGLGSDAPVAAGGGSSVDPRVIEAAALSVSAEPSGIELDLVTTVDPTKLTPQMRSALEAASGAGGENDSLTWVPEDAYGVVSTDGLRAELEAALTQAGGAGAAALGGLGLTGTDGVVAHLTGDAALEVSPGAGHLPTGGVVIGTDDPEGMRAFLNRVSAEVASAVVPQPLDSLGPNELRGLDGASARRLERLLNSAVRSAPASWTSSTYKGVTIRSLELPPSLTGTNDFGLHPSYAVVDGAAIIAASPEAIHAMVDAHDGTDISESAGYRSATAALGGSDAQLLYVDLDRVVAAVREALPPDERASFDAGAAPNLEPLDAFVAGSRSTSAGSTTRMVLLIR
jgi:Protein of unknown function (DUF3352)